MTKGLRKRAGKTVWKIYLLLHLVWHLNGREVGRIVLLCGKAVPPKLDSAMAVLKRGRLISDED